MTVRIRSAAAAAALLLVAGLGLLTAPSPARAATPDLTLVSAATYDVVPAGGRIDVTAAVTVTNHLKDTVTRRFFFQTTYLAVLPGTSGFKITAPGLKPTVSVSSHKSTYTLLKLNFGAPLAAGKSEVMTLQFSIKDPGGAPDRVVRVSPSIVSFTAWAFASADTPGSSVTVRFPPGYTVAIGRGPMHGPTTDGEGRDVWESGVLATPLTFIADVTADRPSDYATRTLTALIGDRAAAISLQSWPDDTAWRDRVGGLVVRGLPALGSEIGLPWPIADPLIVQEALVRNTGGYAGLFDLSAKRIQISYIASSVVVLHEAAHAWFNGRLVADRWAAEAFASYYADVAASALKIKVTSPVLTDALKKEAFPLNAWGALGSAPAAGEAYGYAASLAFARAVSARAGDEALRAVWAAAADGIGAYQPSTGGEPLGQVPDWRGLLDLFDATTGTSFDDLWRQWIARPEDMPLLDARAAARAAYDRAVRDAGSWTLPRSIRDEMRAWEFEVATDGLAAAEGVLNQRAQLEAAASGAGLTLPPTLRADFEGPNGLPAASAEASAELTTIAAIQAAVQTEPGSAPGTPTILIAIGLLGADPAAEIATARTDFATGQLEDAVQAASDAATAWTAAERTGRTRIVSVGLLALALLLFGRTIRLRGRREVFRVRHAYPVPGSPAPAPGPGRPDPYATLAPDPTRPSEGVERAVDEPPDAT